MAQETVKELVSEFLSHLTSQKRSPSTLLAYKSDLGQFTQFLLKRSKPLANQVLQSDIEAFRDGLLAEKYTPKSVSRKLNAIKTFFRYLISEKKLTSNPADKVAHPRFKTSLPQFLSPIEYRALRDVVREDIRASTIVELILQTGMRISEVANLKLKDIQKDHLIIEAYASQPERKVPLNKPAKEALERYLSLRPKSDTDFVFVSKNGKPLAVRNIRSVIDRYMQRADIPQYSVNDLRNTFMVENLKQGVDIVYLSQIAGHRRLSTTERYLELAEVKEPGKKQQLAEL